MHACGRTESGVGAVVPGLCRTCSTFRPACKRPWDHHSGITYDSPTLVCQASGLPARRIFWIPTLTLSYDTCRCLPATTVPPSLLPLPSLPFPSAWHQLSLAARANHPARQCTQQQWQCTQHYPKPEEVDRR